jgi:hypothetical protein
MPKPHRLHAGEYGVNKAKTIAGNPQSAQANDKINP